MEFTNTFHVPLPIEEAWTLMLDVPRILPCLPGARLTEVIGKNTYRGAVSVKLGPVKLAFEGQAELVRQDDVAHIAWLKGSGMDPKGRGSAQSEFSFALQPAGSGTDVTVTTRLQLMGAVAQYGRGSGMIAEVAGQILNQFEENLEEMLLEERQSGAAVAQPAAAPTVPGRGNVSDAPVSIVAAPQPSGVAAGQMPAGPQDLKALYDQAQAILAQAQAVLAATNQALAEIRRISVKARESTRKKELNGFSLLWRAIWSKRQQEPSGTPPKHD
jgi:uncharacterized protein